jgi:hypothetical protein
VGQYINASAVHITLLENGKGYVEIGGGWVNDFEPDAEFQETINKSKGPKLWRCRRRLQNWGDQLVSALEHTMSVSRKLRSGLPNQIGSAW